MADVESLNKIRQAESESRRVRDTAEKEAAAMVKNARTDAERILEDEAAQTAHEAEQIIVAARTEASKERERIVKTGRTAGNAILARSSTKAFERSVDVLLEKFETRIKE
jgi:vacuolar-type H+-ATPase subunit H